MRRTISRCRKKRCRRISRLSYGPSTSTPAKARNQGRLAPLECSVKAPKVSEIFRAAEKLGLNPEIVKDKAHPATWTDKSGMVVVDNKGPKPEIIRKIGTEIIRLRGGKQ